jgi:hypothetical protein
VAAEKAEREKRVARRQHENERFEAWEQWYYDQISMMESERQAEKSRHSSWERERQTQLRQMERTVRRALVEQLARIRDEVRGRVISDRRFRKNSD